MSALDKYLTLSFHNPTWGEMTLTEQGEVRDAAAAELAALQSALAEAQKDAEFMAHVWKTIQQNGLAFLSDYGDPDGVDFVANRILEKHG